MYRSAPLLSLALASLLAGCSQIESLMGSSSSEESATTTTGTTAQAPTHTSADVATLVPKDAIAYVEISSLGEIDTMLRDVAKLADDPMLSAMLSVDALAGMATGGAGKTELLDRSKPIGIAVELGTESEPLPTFLLPCLDAAGFARSLGSLPGGPEAEVEGDYVVVSMAGDYRKSGRPHALAVDVPEGQVALRIDLASVSDQIRPLVDMGLSQAGGMAQMQGAEGSELAVLDHVSAGAGTFLDSAETLEIGYTMRAGELDVTVGFTAKEGSELARYGSQGTTQMPRLAHYVDPDETFAVCVGADSSFFKDRVEPFVADMLSTHPEGQQVLPFLPYFASVRRMLGTTFAVSGNFAKDGARLTWYCKPRDEGAFSNWLETTFATLTDNADYMELTGPTRRAAGDIAVTEWSFRVPDATADMRTDRVARQRAEMTEVFGDETMRVRLASNGEHLAIVVGGDDGYFQSAIDQLANGATSTDADLERAVSWVGNANPSFVATLDAAEIAAQTQDLTRRLAELHLGEGGLAAAGIALPTTWDEPVPVTYYGAIDGRTWRFGAMLDVEGLIALAKAASADN